MDRESLLGRFDLTERVAIIAAGSRGIGRAIAIAFAALGARVVIASRKAGPCEETAAAIVAEGGTALTVPTHVGDPDQLGALVDATVDRFGGVDIVVNNAANPLALRSRWWLRSASRSSTSIWWVRSRKVVGSSRSIMSVPWAMPWRSRRAGVDRRTARRPIDGRDR